MDIWVSGGCRVHQKLAPSLPFLSSMVTVSFAHFIKNLGSSPLALVVWAGKALRYEAQLEILLKGIEGVLT